MAEAKAVKKKPTEEEPDEEEVQEEASVKRGIEIDIVGPLSFWVVMLVIGIAMELFIAPLMGSIGATSARVLASSAGQYILYLPGSLILPLVVAIWVGERVGAKRNKVGSAVSVGLINAVYAALIYAVAIFIIYLLLYYILPSFLMVLTLTTFLIYVVAIPILIVIILVPVIGALSAARHSSM
jgi:hypothetical protein